MNSGLEAESGVDLDNDGEIGNPNGSEWTVVR